MTCANVEDGRLFVIQDYAVEFEANDTPAALIDAMVAKYPHHGNLWTLQFSAITGMADTNFGS